MLALLLKTPILNDFQDANNRNIIEKELFQKYVERYRTEKGILLKRVLYGIVAKK